MRKEIEQKEWVQILFILVGFLCMCIYVKHRNMVKATTNPQFTVGEVVLTKKIAGAKYFEFKYKRHGRIYTSDQAFMDKIRAVKGMRYLLVYNKQNHNDNRLIGIELQDSLGSNLNSRYSVEKLKEEGYIPYLF